jgi:transcriptional regulator with XRE-family HTH domain
MTDTNDTTADCHPRDDPERLRELYHEEGLSQAEIGDRLGVSQNAVQLWMIDHDIDTRATAAPADSHADGPPYDLAYRDPEYLRVAYWGRGQTLSEIAGTLGVAVNTVARWMRKHNIPRRGKDLRPYRHSNLNQNDP